MTLADGKAQALFGVLIVKDLLDVRVGVLERLLMCTESPGPMRK